MGCVTLLRKCFSFQLDVIASTVHAFLDRA